MIITRTPFRISFFGGGTDHPSWYRENESTIISTSINKYCFITLRVLPPYFNFKYRLRYFQVEERLKRDQINHPVVREVLKLLKFNEGIELVHYGDIPARSGIGSSSSFTVGFLHAMHALTEKFLTPRELATKAINLEQNILKENVGSQDQVAAAFGGMNKITFHGDNFKVEPLLVPKNNLEKLQDSILFCYTGIPRNSDTVAKNQIKNIKTKKKELIEMNKVATEALEIFKDKNFSIKEFGSILDYQYQLKKKLNPSSSNNMIDRIYQKAKNLGAIGGKICGAGSGGFLLMIAQKKYHNLIINNLNKFLFVPIRFENTGSQIVYYSHE